MTRDEKRKALREHIVEELKRRGAEDAARAAVQINESKSIVNILSQLNKTEAPQAMLSVVEGMEFENPKVIAKMLRMLAERIEKKSREN